MTAGQVVYRIILGAIRSEAGQNIARYALRQAAAAVIRHIQGATPRTGGKSRRIS